MHFYSWTLCSCLMHTITFPEEYADMDLKENWSKKIVWKNFLEDFCLRLLTFSLLHLLIYYTYLHQFSKPLLIFCLFFQSFRSLNDMFGSYGNGHFLPKKGSSRQIWIFYNKKYPFYFYFKKKSRKIIFYPSKVITFLHKEKD